MFELFTLYPIFFYCCVGLFSLLVGSFLNVVIYRLPIIIERDWIKEFTTYYQITFTGKLPGNVSLEEPYNLALPHSTCPHCQHKIRATENIPIVSFLRQGGKCSQCSGKIASRYPIIEGLTALVGVWVALHFGMSYSTGIILIVSFLLIAMIAIDIDKMLLPDQLTLPMLWIGLAASTQNLFVSPSEAIIGAILGYGFLWSVYWGFKLLTGKEGMGYGDFKLLAAIGAFVGWQHLLIVILLSSVVGVVIGLLLPLLQKQQSADASVPNNAFPFGPFLGIAGWLTILYGDVILELYIAWLV